MVTVEPHLALAATLLVVGIIGSLVPFVPGPVFSLAGVGGYWWLSGFESPSPAVLVAIALVGGVAILVDLLGGAIAAEASGVSRSTVFVAAVGGIVLTVLFGPFGLLLGVPVIVFAATYNRSRNVSEAARAGVKVFAGILGTNAAQALLCTVIAVLFLLSL